MSLMFPVFGLLFVSIWIIGLYNLNGTLMLVGAVLCALNLILIFALLLTLPFSGFLNKLNDLLDRWVSSNQKADSVRQMQRRKFLKTTAAIIPTIALTSGLSGAVGSFNAVRVKIVPIYFDNLPPELDGFRILHITDIHIGYYIWLHDLEDVFEEARQMQPDIVLATGDLCDRLDVYTDMLKMVDQINAPLGVYSCIGNHEYFRGFRQVARSFEKSGIPLLLNNGIRVFKNGRSLYIGGADDPRFLNPKGKGFFEHTIDSAFALSYDDEFKIALSHRPQAFDYAAKRGIDLTLAGHTHGGQLGFAGRSVFETVFGKEYLWGEYQKGDKRLYTSAGIGHWFPFRLGCPAEAPILELRRSA